MMVAFSPLVFNPFYIVNPLYIINPFYITSSHLTFLPGDLLVAGTTDGHLTLFDLRVPGSHNSSVVASVARHEARVQKIHLQRGGEDGGRLVSLDVNGNISCMDPRVLFYSPRVVNMPNVTSYLPHGHGDYATTSASPAGGTDVHPPAVGVARVAGASSGVVAGAMSIGSARSNSPLSSPANTGGRSMQSQPFSAGPSPALLGRAASTGTALIGQSGYGGVGVSGHHQLHPHEQHEIMSAMHMVGSGAGDMVAGGHNNHYLHYQQQQQQQQQQLISGAPREGLLSWPNTYLTYHQQMQLNQLSSLYYGQNQALDNNPFSFYFSHISQHYPLLTEQLHQLPAYTDLVASYGTNPGTIISNPLSSCYSGGSTWTDASFVTLPKPPSFADRMFSAFDQGCVTVAR